MKSGRRNKNLIILALLAAAIGRGWNLWNRGLMEHDEGHALLNANTWWHVIRWALGGGLWSAQDGGAIAQLRDTLHQQGGTLYSAGKLGYSLLVAVAGLPTHVSTNLALGLAWIAGITVALLAAVLAWQYTRSKPAAIIAAGGCLTSPLLIDLSREASGTIWALVFGLAGAALINMSITANHPRKRRALGLAGGGLLGYGFSCHFNLAPFILAVYLSAAAYAWPIIRQSRHAGSGVSSLIRRLLPAAFGGLGMLAIFEAATQAADYILRNSYPDFLPFSGELHRLFFRDQAPMLKGVLYGDGAIGWGPEAWAIYGHALLREGPAWILLMLALTGICIGMRRSGNNSSGKDRLSDATTISSTPPRIIPPAILLLLPALFWAAYIYRVERSLGMCMAVSWILIGVIFGPILERHSANGWQRTVTEIFAVMQIAAAGIASFQLAELKSPLPNIVAKTFDAPMASGKLITAGSFDVGFAPLWKWEIVQYQRQSNTNAPAGPHVDFARFDGAQIAFIDPSTWHRPNPDFHITRQQAEAGHVITAEKTNAPPWTVWSVLINSAQKQ